MMKMIHSFLILISLQTYAGLDANYWSLRYLARASNTLLVASQQSLDQQKVVCGISGGRISSLSQSLKALIDAKTAHLTAAQKETIRQQAQSCAKECSCDIFAYYFEQNSDPQDKMALEKTNAAAAAMTAESRLACAKKFPEFCQSQLLKFISK